MPGRPALERFADARVLMIDDEPANLALLEQMLRRAGLRNLHALGDSREALGRIEELDPDLVLLDLHMPVVDGYAVLAGLRARAGGAYLPVLVLTADTTHDAITRALELGARDFLTKPFDLTEATLRVRNLLETKELHEMLRHNNMDLRQRVGDLERAASSDAEERRVISERIRRVLHDGGISMVFQPVFEVPGGRVVGCEALARFPDGPARGPDRWFADAAAVGAGPELEVAAVAEAMSHLPDLPPHLFLAVNVSPSAAMAPGLHALIDRVDGSRIILELTEHVPVEDYDAVCDGLAALRAHGVRLALDDMGAGYAGFRHLLGLRPDVIKLDISLTRDIDRDAVRRALASALVSFAADVDAQVVAEGVENAEELETLTGLSVPWVQGFHLGRPVDMTELVARVAAP